MREIENFEQAIGILEGLKGRNIISISINYKDRDGGYKYKKDLGWTIQFLRDYFEQEDRYCIGEYFVSEKKIEKCFIDLRAGKLTEEKKYGKVDRKVSIECLVTKSLVEEALKMAKTIKT